VAWSALERQIRLTPLRIVTFGVGSDGLDVTVQHTVLCNIPLHSYGAGHFAEPSLTLRCWSPVDRNHAQIPRKWTFLSVAVACR